MTPRLYSPVLDCFMRGLPYGYRSVEAPEGVIVEVTVSGDCGGTWWLHRQPDLWSLVTRPDSAHVASRTIVPQDIAWRMFTRGIDRAQALRQTTIIGDQRLGLGVLGILAIVG